MTSPIEAPQDITLKDIQIPEQREKLIDVFMDRNSKINLSAIRTREGVYTKHILDALEIKKLEIFEKINTKRSLSVIDLWTGWWFPLLPLAMSYPHIQRTGLDARRKKIDAINAMAKELWLTNCTWFHGRAEEHKKKYDLVTARAVAYFDKLFPRLDRLLKPWGAAILYKLYTPEEDRLIFKTCKQKKRMFIKKQSYTLPWDDVKKCLYVLRKR